MQEKESHKSTFKKSHLFLMGFLVGALVILIIFLTQQSQQQRVSEEISTTRSNHCFAFRDVVLNEDNKPEYFYELAELQISGNEVEGRFNYLSPDQQVKSTFVGTANGNVVKGVQSFQDLSVPTKEQYLLVDAKQLQFSFGVTEEVDEPHEAVAKNQDEREKQPMVRYLKPEELEYDYALPVVPCELLHYWKAQAKGEQNKTDGFGRSPFQAIPLKNNEISYD